MHSALRSNITFYNDFSSTNPTNACRLEHIIYHEVEPSERNYYEIPYTCTHCIHNWQMSMCTADIYRLGVR